MASMFKGFHFDGTKVAIILWVVAQFLFLSADVPSGLSHSRGPYSDEGLNTFAVRNFINSGFSEMPESDNFIKSPGLAAALFVPFIIAVNDWSTGRAVMIILVAFCLYLFAKRLKLGSLFVLLMLVSPVTFHFSRFMMGDVLSVLIPIVGYVVFLSWLESGNAVFVKQIFLLVLLASLGPAFKVQAVAMWLLLILAICIVPLNGMGFKQKFKAMLLGMLPFVVIYTSIFIFQKDLANYIFNQVGEYYNVPGLTKFEILAYNRTLHLVGVGEILSWSWFFIGLTCLFLAAKFEWKYLMRCIPLFAMWFYQFSGMFMGYFPPRYAAGLYVASFALLAVLMHRLSFKVKPFAFGLAVLIILFGVFIGTPQMEKDFNERTYKVYAANDRIAESDDVKVLIGSWSPTFTFLSTNKTAYPIWDSYLTFANIEKPIAHYNADLIVAESDEEGSGKAYKKRGVYLESIEKIDSLEIEGLQLNFWKMP